MPQISRHNQDLASLLSLTFSSLNQELHMRLNEMGFTDVRPAHGFLFQGLIPDGSTAKALVQHLGITKQAVSQMVDELEARGYVARKPHPSDGRGKLIILTERGWSVVRSKEKIYTEVEERWAKIIGHNRMKELHEDLLSIVNFTSEGNIPHRLRPVW
ncbi:MarR family winged helix-turn-helix transcriptional regulator [Paenibacillus pini]|uniref:Transcriptional regulator n=1 Tax=Paenibacillus pini JCM 16418 TaxID=1236976 RepID=W7YMC3_9BACL|nr:MarR family transcriptional regulator [Paenibacillus pini]GAF09577.1 transcriptional regulator [Paenibacillus pini JCM 16418]